MKKSKFTEAHTAFALKQSETGTRVDEICRKIGISQATFFNWKKKYGGLGVNETLNGLLTRACSKISSIAVFQYLNFINNKPLNLIKHALALIRTTG